MDDTTPTPAVRINRWLPYWAVFQMDLRQTLRSWVYRAWVAVSLAATIGYLLFKGGVRHEASIVVSAAHIMSNVLRWTVLGSVTLIVVLTAGSISAERGTLADSVLSRGISRYQYFLGKWHARLAVVLVTFIVLAGLALGGCTFLHEDLSAPGSLVALAAVTAVLCVIVTCGVTVSAFVNSTLVAIAMLWLVLYGLGITLSLLPDAYPSPDRMLNQLPFILRGNYDLPLIGRLMGWSFLTSIGIAVCGLLYFSRRDV
jgi:hypothetical protein